MPLFEETIEEVVGAMSWDGARAMIRQIAAELGHDPADLAPNIALGVGLLISPMLCNYRINVWRTRESWEAHGRDGIVVIDWPACALELLDFDEIVAEDPQLGELIEAEIRRAKAKLEPAMPRILVEG